MTFGNKYKEEIFLFVFFVLFCLFLAILTGQDLEAGTDLRTTKPYQLIGNNASEKILDIENDEKNMILYAETHTKEVPTQWTGTTKKGVWGFFPLISKLFPTKALD